VAGDDLLLLFVPLLPFLYQNFFQPIPLLLLNAQPPNLLSDLVTFHNLFPHVSHRQSHQAMSLVLSAFDLEAEDLGEKMVNLPVYELLI
jgi:L-alanine-DL-glutamate epimerase-like enolase superfamily enzyme